MSAKDIFDELSSLGALGPWVSKPNKDLSANNTTPINKEDLSIICDRAVLALEELTAAQEKLNLALMEIKRSCDSPKEDPIVTIETIEVEPAIWSTWVDNEDDLPLEVFYENLQT